MAMGTLRSLVGSRRFLLIHGINAAAFFERLRQKKKDKLPVPPKSRAITLDNSTTKSTKSKTNA